MTSLEIRVDPSTMGFDPVRLERITTHFDRYVEGPAPARAGSRRCRAAGNWRGPARGGHRDRENGARRHRRHDLAHLLDDQAGHLGRGDDALRGGSLRPQRRRRAGGSRQFAEPRVYVWGHADRAQRPRPRSEPVRDAPPALAHERAHLRLPPLAPGRRDLSREGLRLRPPTGRGPRRARSTDWCASPLLFEPGTRWNYSESTTVLGRLVEIWSGQPLDEFFRTRILDPLGMADTDWWCPPRRADRLAHALRALPAATRSPTRTSPAAR